MPRAEEHLQSWLSAGLISAADADRIRAHEAATTQPSSGQSRVAEALGYVGGALALVALTVVIDDFWAELDVWAQAALLALLAGVLFAGGWWIRDRQEPPVHRLASVLWLLSVAAFAGFAQILTGDAAAVDDDVAVLGVSAVTAVYAGWLWRLRPTALQHLALALAVAATVFAALYVREGLIFDEFVGLALWGLAVVWLLLTWGGMLRPDRTGYALGAVGALAGAQWLAVGELDAWGTALGLATAVAMIVCSVAINSLVLLALGAVGAFLFVSQAVFRYFEDTIGVPIALFLVGLSLVGAALLITRLRPRVIEQSDV
jgi:hypothetical protein